MSHDDGAGEESDDTWKSHELSKEIGKVAVKEDEASLFDGFLIDGLVNFEEVAEAEARDGAKGHTEKEQVAEVHHHLFSYFIPSSNHGYLPIEISTWFILLLSPKATSKWFQIKW